MMHVAVDTGRSLLIGGRWEAAAETMPVVNPWSGEALGAVACADGSHVERAVASALRGAEAMRDLSTGERSRILHAAATALAADAERFAAAITAETGKSIRAATREVARAVNTLRLSAEEALRLAGETIAFDSFPGGEARSGHYVYEPVGVIAAITPFNDPLNLVCHKLGPAFAAGNAVVLKPAEQAPLVAVLLAKLLLAEGLPAEALNLLTGRGCDFGGALTGHPGVAMVSFTGGANVGQAICRSAGIKRVAMELGGNGPVIVMDDADVEKAAAACVSGAFGAAGQNCIGVQRLYVHDAIYDVFREALVAAAGALRVGDPMDPATDVGPMIGGDEAARIVGWADEAVARGATLLAGGERAGALVRPTLLADVPDDARVACHEAFGPVVSLFRFADLDEAIDAANRADYAIHAAIFTESLRHARHAARRLRAAGVMINDSTDYRLDAMPFGGAGRGNMGREGVRFAAREMSQTKVICFHDA
ncbi:aldehyde dehydrogenase family protein [Sphingopyxis sp.]|uniref:aldehyde dehydrogenase family protein n=1 Tax=Sphingopyxis sp. TaxID=1908224 RepID=UPI0026186BCD|nr:aldehyde dehydrogenase family protein [Sphingopyxis sp.]MCW0197880.1 aldehyde dehydrogenase family protein [Sphingopyxis sp.]